VFYYEFNTVPPTDASHLSFNDVSSLTTIITIHDEDINRNNIEKYMNSILMNQSTIPGHLKISNLTNNFEFASYAINFLTISILYCEC
jgi:hypothetical protein